MTAVPVSTTSFTVAEPPFRTYVRSPVTALRLLGLVVASALMFFPLQQSGHRRFGSDLGASLADAPTWLVSGVVAASQLGFLVPTLLFVVSQIAQRRFVRLGRMLVASVICVAGLLAMSNIVGASIFPIGPVRHAGRAYGIGGPFPTAADLGVIAAWLFMDGHRWLPRWRRIGYLVLGLGILARIGVGLADPTTILATLLIAGAATEMVRLAIGATNTQPRAQTVGTILEDLGYALTHVERFRAFRGYTGFRVQRADGGMFYVKVVGRDSWATLLPVRLYQAARFREGPTDGPFRSVRSGVEHEAMCALMAYSAGVSTPRLAVVTEYPPSAMLMAFESQIAEPLSRVDPERRTPEMLAEVWSILAVLQRSHIVHHHFNLEAVIVDEQDAVALIEFGAASIGVTGPALSTDIAEVLAGTAARLGVEPAVQAAVVGVGAPAVAATLSRLQPLALTRPTRAALQASGCLDELRDEVQRVTGANAVPVAVLERIRLRSLITITMVALAIWTLAPQFVGMSAVWAKLGDANWWWVVAALGLSAVTYLGAAFALNGSLAERVPMTPNLEVQVATSFVGVAIPGGALALTARFLQKRGVDGSAAAAAVGVDTLAGVVVHLTLTGLFLLFAGSSGLQRFNLPSLGTVAVLGLGVVAVLATGLAVPWIRRMVTTRLMPSTRRSLASMSEVTRRPARVVELFGGCFLITLGYILALEVAVEAFGAGPSFTSVALVYLVGSVVSSIAPTPGGVGLVEATLIAGLTSAGMASPTAVAAVLTFRIATFWLPLLPGWGALTLLQRSGAV